MVDGRVMAISHFLPTMMASAVFRGSVSDCFAFAPFTRSTHYRHDLECNIRKFESKAHTPTKLFVAEDASLADGKKKILVYEHDVKQHAFNGDIFAKSNCWGRRPFLMRGAFDPDELMRNSSEEDDPLWPSWSDVVDIASDDDSESRVISHRPGHDDSYQLEWGPLSEDEVDEWISLADDTNRDALKRTLVVNDIDRFYPPLADWMYDNFNFLPNWRMDDGQISLAEESGGIGPHVDNYDVFLIQMSGHRRWQVGCSEINVKSEIDRSIPDLDVRILNDWGVNAEFEEWILNPGDMLYLPPRIAHCGTALTNGCMTLSVGCRAPSVSDLVSRLAENLSTSIEQDAVCRYTDEHLLSGEDKGSFSNGELTVQAKQKARKLVLESVTKLLGDDKWWDCFFGRYVTEQKRVRMNYPIPLDEGDDAINIIKSVLNGDAALYQAEGIAFVYSSLPANDPNRSIYRLFANGLMWQFEVQNDDVTTNCMVCLYKTIANHRRLDAQSLCSCYGDVGGESQVSEVNVFLEQLLKIGVIYALASE